MKFTIKNLDQKQIRHYMLLGFGIFLFVYAVFVFYWISHKRYAGFYVFPGEDGILRIIDVQPGSPAEKMDLKPGDQILKVDGRDCLHPISWFEIFWNVSLTNESILHPFRLFLDLWKSQERESFVLTYQRDGSVMTGKLVTDPPVFPYFTFIGLLFCFLTYTLCLLVYLKRPFDISTRIFYLAGCCASVASIGIFNVFAIIINPFNGISGFSLFFLPVSLHFALIFPETKKIVREHPSIIYIIFAPVCMWLFMEGMFILKNAFQFYFKGQNGPVPEISSHIIVMSKSLMALILIYLTMSFGCIAHTFFVAENSERKKQIMWLFSGGALSLALGFIGCFKFFGDNLSIPLIFNGGAHLPVTWFLGFFLFFFVTSLAILKYKLMDIDIIIHHSLAYIIVGGASLLLYFLIFGALSWFFEVVSGVSTYSIYATSALIVAFIFRPLLTQIEQRMDKLFLREKYALQKAVETLIHAITAVRDTKMIFQKVFHAVEKTLYIQSGALWLLDASGKSLEKSYVIPEDLENMASESIACIPADHPLISNLKELKKGLTHYQVREEKMLETERDIFMGLFQETRMEIFLPLIFKDSLFGVIGFGEKRSGDLYTSDDVRMLTILAHQAAVAMENARAYHQIKELNKEMGEKVRHIEQQHKEILVLQKKMLHENIYLREELKQQCHFEEIIGSSPQMKQALDMVEKVAPTQSTVLIRGESGTGKELIARAVHANSPRQDRPFIKVNCAAIPVTLLESELFGHEKGAFTGAVSQKQGKFEMASSGTIFLDEIGDIGPDLQVKLLRVLQEKEFERVGGTKTIKVDVRIISATNRDIESAISQNKFREDLFYRLNVITITMPPLRQRDGDIRELAIHFIKKFSRQLNKPIQNIDIDAMKILKAYSWPGNVRELANIIERAMVLGEGNNLSAQDLPKSLAAPIDAVSSAENDNFSNEMKQIEYQRINQAIEQANGNKSEAARILGMKRSTLNSKLRRFNSPSKK